MNKEFINAIINDRAANAGHWQMQIEAIKSNYVLITDLLSKEQELSSEMINRCQDLQGQLIRMLTQFVLDMDESEGSTTSDSQALLDRHIHQMSALNGSIDTFLGTLHSTSDYSA